MLNHKKMGQFPNANRKAYFETLQNYKSGKFQNLVDTPALADGESMTKLLCDFVSKQKDTVPNKPIPSIQTDLKNLNPNEDVFVWFGHSSYFIQTDGLKLLVDPVFSGNASPMPGSIKAFEGANNYSANDLPEIDVLFISHDHWDHLDYDTMEKIKHKTKMVVCGLGVAQHFEYWGWDKNKLIEKNWYESVEVFKGFKITLTPARHFSGRLLKRNISLWTSFVVETPTKKLFLGGDSGYGPQFKDIGEKFGPFDLAILECGQYNLKWPYIHSQPKELITEVKELKAKNFIPVHNSKFKLALHPWYEPLELIVNYANEEKLPITTPMIGEKVDLSNLSKTWEKWWQKFM